MKRRHYPSLDGLRAVAVAVVLVSHTGAPFPRSGGVGVDVFFTLSGFLITSLLLREFETYGSISFLNFYLRRFLRLMPALWLTVGFVVVSTWSLDVYAPWLFREAGFALGYITNWARILGASDRVVIANGYVVDSPLAHTWSLAIEEQYYLLWPIVISALCRHVQTASKRVWVLLAIFASIVMYRAASVGWYSAERIYFGLDTHADGLILGSTLAAALPCYPRLWRGRTRLTRIVLTLLALASLAMVMMLWTWQDPIMGWLGFAICAVASVVLILDGIFEGPSLLRPILSTRLLVWLGVISYGLYLWHFPVYFVLRHWSLIWNWQRMLFVGGGITLAMATASYYLVELRFLALKKHFEREAPAAHRKVENVRVEVARAVSHAAFQERRREETGR